MTHAEAVDLFRRAPGSKCHLLIQRLILPKRSHSSSTSSLYPFAHPGCFSLLRTPLEISSNFLRALENTFEVNLNRGHAGLGLSLSGGLAENRPIEIIDIYRNQPAAQSGQLEIGDVILAINEHPMYNRNVRVSS